ncbi:MAG: hypothetical protein J2P57_08575 [Acidimicrobiaceae bacterium]|nr:hypothetical protein [Acidimicrobiaceae bacterium]
MAWSRTKKVAVGAAASTALLVGVIAAASGGGSEAEPPAGVSQSQAEQQAPAEQPAENAPAPVEKPAPVPEKAATPVQRLQQAVDDSRADSPRVSREAKGVYVINFDVGDNLTAGMIRTGVAMDVFDMAEKINESGVSYQKLIFWGEGPLTDAYGNTEDGLLFRATFTNDTVQRINWDSFVSSWDGLEQLADGFVYLHPSLR